MTNLYSHRSGAGAAGISQHRLICVLCPTEAHDDIHIFKYHLHGQSTSECSHVFTNVLQVFQTLQNLNGVYQHVYIADLSTVQSVVLLIISYTMLLCYLTYKSI